MTLIVFWAGPFAPLQTAGVTLGELAADIAKSAARSVSGQPQPEPVGQPRTIGNCIEVGVGALAGLAIAFGVASFVRHERKRAAISGIALGGLAVGVQLFTWSVGMIVGGFVIMGLVFALREVIGNIFDAPFSG